MQGFFHPTLYFWDSSILLSASVESLSFFFWVILHWLSISTYLSNFPLMGMTKATKNFLEWVFCGHKFWFPPWITTAFYILKFFALCDWIWWYQIIKLNENSALNLLKNETHGQSVAYVRWNHGLIPVLLITQHCSGEGHPRKAFSPFPTQSFYSNKTIF